MAVNFYPRRFYLTRATKKKTTFGDVRSSEGKLFTEGELGVVKNLPDSAKKITEDDYPAIRESVPYIKVGACPGMS